jgi:hypothetical protein
MEGPLLRDNTSVRRHILIALHPVGPTIDSRASLIQKAVFIRSLAVDVPIFRVRLTHARTSPISSTIR